MKVLFLYQQKSLPSSRVRVFNLLPQLAAAGLEAICKEYPHTLTEKRRLLREVGRYSVVVLQKKLLTPFDAWTLRVSARRLVYDFDDAVYLRNEKDGNERSFTRYLKFLCTVKAAHCAVAGNRILAAAARRHHKNVAVLPSAVPVRAVPQKDYSQHQDTFVVGWVGSGGNLPHLDLIRGALHTLSRRFAIAVHVLSDSEFTVPGVRVRNIPWDLQSEQQHIACFDAGVMPLPKNRWAEGKCGYKALQYMAASVVPVVSGVGINSEIVQHGKEGLVVPEPAGFYNALKKLIQNRDLCRVMGRNARKKVAENYSVEVVGARLVEILTSLR